VDKTEAISTVLALVDDAPVVFTTGYTSRIGASLADRPNHFYMTGSMGLALPLGMGVALATRRPAVVLDGDGSVLMNPAGMLTAAVVPDLPLVHLVLDDGAYTSTGGQPTGSAAVDLVGLAAGSGYRHTRQVQDADGLGEAVREALDGCSAPWFIRCLLEPDDLAPPPRIGVPLDEIARRFSGHLTQRQAAV